MSKASDKKQVKKTVKPKVESSNNNYATLRELVKAREDLKVMLTKIITEQNATHLKTSFPKLILASVIAQLILLGFTFMVAGMVNF
jgi:hypothetical protein